MMKETLYYNAKVFTSDLENREANAFTIKNGKFNWVGDLCDIEEEKELQEIERVDLKGRRVLPGFVDSHMHAVMLANCCKQIAALPPEVFSIEELTAEVKKRREELAKSKYNNKDFLSNRKLWIEGWGFDEGKFKEKRAPLRWDLDKGAEDVPVYILRSCVHIASVNSKALELAGIDRNTKDPEGGIIGRDENGEPNGLLYETARYLVNQLMPPLTEDDLVNNLLDLDKILLSQGVTTCSDLCEFTECDFEAVFDRAVKKGFKNKVGYYYLFDYVKKNPDLFAVKIAKSKGLKAKFCGVKLIGDGSVSGNTAWTDEAGLPTCSEEDIKEAICWAKENGCQVSMHAMGNKTIDRAVKMMAEEENWMEDAPCFRVEHVTMPSKEAIKLASEKGIAFVTQPIFQYCEIESYLNNLGAEKTKEIYPIKDWLDNDIKFAFSTDAPATSWATPSDPMPGLKSAVNRIAWDGTDLGERHRVSIEEAIMRYTSYGAEILGLKNVGKIKKNYDADFVVLDKDIIEIEPILIDTVKVAETYISGNREYIKE